MARKMTVEQFMVDCVNKEFELIGKKNIHFASPKELYDWARKEKNKHFYNQYKFTTQDQVDNFRNFFLTHSYWKSIHMYPRQRERELGWFKFMYGFKHADNLE